MDDLKFTIPAPGNPRYRVRVARVPIVRGGMAVDGICHRTLRLIELRADLPLARRWSTLLHELTHAYIFECLRPNIDNDEALCDFVAMVAALAITELNIQGGEAALMAMWDLKTCSIKRKFKAEFNAQVKDSRQRWRDFNHAADLLVKSKGK